MVEVRKKPVNQLQRKMGEQDRDDRTTVNVVSSHLKKFPSFFNSSGSLKVRSLLMSAGHPKVSCNRDKK